ncbi:MAG: Clp1/GlmU family protein [Metallosphaera sp.]|uniref:Clp1/GlmU family protein n=1 Tax=Metallosphaera sp. TaxID=2020860 RepID=UPI00317941C3
MKVDPGRYVVLRGPCNLNVTQGEAQILGLAKKTYVIASETTFSIFSARGAEIESDCSYVTNLPALGWENIGEIVAMTGGRVIVIGAQDSGKSYLSKLIYNMTDNFLYVDLDVGQSSLFLPSFVSSIRGKELFFENPLMFTRLEFFGDITPSRDPKRHIILATKLTESEKNVVIDTDGWINNYGLVHKRRLIEYLDPDYIIVFNRNNKLIPREYIDRVIYLSSPSVNQKKKSDRHIIRRNLYLRYFKEAKVREAPTFGERVKGIRSLCLNFDSLEGLILGLIKENRVVGAGLLHLAESLEILTPVNEFDDFYLGLISLDREWRERRIL